MNQLISSQTNTTYEFTKLKENFDDIFLLMNGIIVSLMQAGFACLEAGAVRTKNTINILMKNLMDLFIAAIVYFLVGYALGYGNGSSIIGLTFWAGVSLPASQLSHWFFQFIFAATAATILSGAVAERCNFTAYIVYNAAISGFVYPVVSHWAWHDEGWLKAIGYNDFAGSGVVHVLGGVCSLIAAVMLGPRIGRFVNGKPVDIPGHSVPLVGLGALLLVTGFLAFNGGSLGHISQPGDGDIVARSMVSTILGGSGAAAVSLILGKIGLYGNAPWPFTFTLNATLSGMVAVCAGPDIYSDFGAMVTGGIACLCFFGIHHAVIKLKVDDPLDAVAVHFGAGFWGVLSVRIFGENGIVYGPSLESFKNLGINLLGLVAIIIWSAVTSFIIFGGLRYTGLLRISEEEELKGLDLTKHGEIAYPCSAYQTINVCENGRESVIDKKQFENQGFEMDKREQNN